MLDPCLPFWLKDFGSNPCLCHAIGTAIWRLGPIWAGSGACHSHRDGWTPNVVQYCPNVQMLTSVDECWRMLSNVVKMLTNGAQCCPNVVQCCQMLSNFVVILTNVKLVIGQPAWNTIFGNVNECWPMLSWCCPWVCTAHETHKLTTRFQNSVRPVSWHDKSHQS